MSQQLAMLEAEVAAQRLLLEELRVELRLTSRSSTVPNSPPEIDDRPEVDSASGGDDRRVFLRRVLGVAAGAGVVGVIGVAAPAAAVNGDAVVVGQSKTGTLPTEVTNTDAGTDLAVSAFKATGPADRIGLSGVASGLTGVGVQGESNAGYGVFGTSTTGYGVYVAGNGRLGTAAHVALGRPASGAYALGDIVRDGAGTIYCCVEAGTPGMFREISGPTSTGALHFINPVRVANTFDGIGVSIGVVPLNGQKTVTIVSPAIPSTALAVIGSVTAYSPSAFSTAYASGGYLAVNAFGGGTAGVSNTFQVNTMFNSSLFVSKLTTGNSVQVNSFGSASHVTIDILGYWS